MRADTTLVMVALALALSCGASGAAETPASPAPAAADPGTGEAKLPLAEILRLYRETREAREKPKVAPPPVRATVHALRLSGRLLDDAVDLTAEFEVAVLDGTAWSSIPLLEHDPATHLSSLPKLDHAFFTVEGGYLRLVTRHEGRYAFSISLLKQAGRDGRRRAVRLRYGEAPLATCRLQFDQGLFRLLARQVLERAEGVMLLPDDGTFAIDWERRADAVETVDAAAPPPAIESSVTLAHASAVSTLEGRSVVRLRYELRFAGRQSIEVELPAGLTLERAYVNGLSIPVEPAQREVSIEVAPVREGDQSAALELVLFDAPGAYLLSGALEVRLPRVSWPVNQMYLDVHLPQVFNYAWSGGSLSPVDDSPAVHFTYDLPLPGKKLSFHQHLIAATAPDVTLDYTVDLEGHFYRP